MQVIEHFDGAKGSIVSMPRITVGQLAMSPRGKLLLEKQSTPGFRYVY